MILSLSLAITISSFVGVPPLIGFFAKQMVLSAALDNGYFFISLLAVLTSVIGAVYYLNIIKEVFFYLPYNKINSIWNGGLWNMRTPSKLIGSELKSYVFTFNYRNVAINTSISVIISIITLIVLLFMFINSEWLNCNLSQQ